jgi:hypothetical protein
MWRHGGDFVVEFVVEIVEEIVDETAGLFRAREAGREQEPKRMHPARAALGYGAIGIFVGVMSLIAWRHGVAPAALRVPSLFAIPVLAGIATQALGLCLRMNGRRTSTFTTFWGGASYAFGIALARFALGYGIAA